MPHKQPKRSRLWLNDGSCARLRPSSVDYVWSCDFVQGWTADGRSFRRLTLIDEYTQECLSIDVAHRLTTEDVLERLSDLFVRRGVSAYIRSDHDPSPPFIGLPSSGPEAVPT